LKLPGAGFESRPWQLFNSQVN